MLKINRPTGVTAAQEKINKRLLVLYLLVIILFVILLGRLFFMQVVKGSEYAQRSENNIYRTITLPARRGTIYDCNGNVLASSQPYMSVEVYPNEVEDEEELAANLAELFSRKDIIEAEQTARETIAHSTLTDTIEEVNRELQQKEKDAAAEKGETKNEDKESGEEDINAANGFLTANVTTTPAEVYEILKKGIGSYAAVDVRSYTYEVGVTIAAIVAENPDLYPGVNVAEKPMRSYPFGYYLGHVLGTVGKITESQLDTMSTYGYTIADTVGQSGLEKYYEYFTEGGKSYSLSGTDGKRMVEVDAKNNILDTISEEAPVAGDSLELTIDLNSQKHMEDSLRAITASVKDANSKGGGGAAVLMDVKTGGILAMASSPSMDPNDFARGLSSAELKYYFDDKLKTQMNRAVSAGYASGSTFKMMTATAVLNAGISPNDSVVCSSGSWVEPLAKCHDHGTVDLYTAVKESCNTYFQKMAARIGEEAMIDMGLKYGFGQKTGVDLPGEVSGLLPTPEWKAQNYTGWESAWHVYDTYYMSMGQGATVDTVIQLACYVTTIANHGERMKPYLCQSILDDEGNVLKTTEPTVVETIDLPEDDWSTLITGMKGVVDDAGGTAEGLFKSMPTTLSPAGKTGTAQTGLAGDDNETEYHGVFIAFAPANDPQVAFAGLVEYGGSGAHSAAYVCRDTFRAYFGYDVDYDILLMDDILAKNKQGTNDENTNESTEDVDTLDGAEENTD